MRAGKGLRASNRSSRHPASAPRGASHLAASPLDGRRNPPLGIITIAAQGLAGMYQSATSLRNYLYDKGLMQTYRSKVPVICVGNVTVGGSGKTPLTDFLASKLLDRGEVPVILSRGYGGKLDGPHLVGAADTVENVGDEAILHAKVHQLEVPVVIAKRRVEGAKFIEDRRLGDVIILDDGYQHRRLEREVNILLLDITDDAQIAQWKNGSLLPLGVLREKLEEAAERAHAIIFVNRGVSNQEPTRLPLQASALGVPGAEELPCFHFELKASHLVDAFSNERAELSAFDGKTGSALTAIAKPHSFFAMCEGIGIELETKKAFRDHHLFSQSDWDTARSESPGPVFTTAKDAVKLRKFLREPGELFILELGSGFSTEEETDAFLQLIDSARNSKETAKRVAR